MELEFSGAAREVTGSCHVLRVGGKTVLLDCGMFQGKRAEARAKNEKLPVEAHAIDAVVVSHAHIDHIGRLPMLAKYGYDKTIWMTAATRDLANIMLADSAHIQESDAEFMARHGREYQPPLYRLADAAAIADLSVGVPYCKWFDVVPGVRACYTDAGHILGSAGVTLECTERAPNGQSLTRRLVFSGDIGRWGLPIIRDPEPPKLADAVIMESTYGNRDHESVDGAREHLARVVRDTAARGGKVIIPAFALGRTQELVYDLHALARDGQIPQIPIYIDSPLAIDTTTVFAQHPEVFDRREDLINKVQNLFHFQQVTYTRDVQESKKLNTLRGPMIIIAASGMAENGRIVHHLKNNIEDSKNTVLVVGFMAEHTTGRRIVEHAPTLKLFGDEVPLRANVEILNGYSAHADRTELRRWLDGVKSTSPALGDVYLVHGEPAAQDALAASFTEAGYRVKCPSPGEKGSI